VRNPENTSATRRDSLERARHAGLIRIGSRPVRRGDGSFDPSRVEAEFLYSFRGVERQFDHDGTLPHAASAHRLPPAVLVILLNVEGGKLGRVSANTNGTVDIGPMQVNEIWLQELSRHWRAPVGMTFLALRDNFCANAEAGAYILRKGLDEAHGDFWSGVGIYHSHDPGYKAAYLRKVFEQALRLQAAVARTAPAPQPAAAQPNAGGR
jgi:hypothetical protein